MKMKNINFLCGLPRSGSTLLSTLLNQHPAIYSSPHSGLLDGMTVLHESFTQSESVRYGLRISAYQGALWTMPQNFYSNIEKEIIFDKQFAWSTPANYEMALKISTNPRFIVCYRPILEVLASFVSKSINNPDFYLSKEFDSVEFYAKNYLSRNDGMAEYLMNDHDLIKKSLLGLAHAKKNEESGVFKFVSYKDLINDPKKELSNIFNFLALESFEIDINDIEDIFLYNDSIALGVSGFHQVRPIIKNESPKPEDLFSDFILNKYANALTPMGL